MKQRTNEWWWYVHYQQNSYSYLIFTHTYKQMCVCFNNTYIWVRVSSFFRWMEDWMHYYSLDCNPGYCGKFVVSFLLLLKTLNTWNSSMTSINPFFFLLLFFSFICSKFYPTLDRWKKKNEKKKYLIAEKGRESEK